MWTTSDTPYTVGDNSVDKSWKCGQPDDLLSNSARKTPSALKNYALSAKCELNHTNAGVGYSPSEINSFPSLKVHKNQGGSEK